MLSIAVLTLVLCAMQSRLLPTVPQIQDEFSYLLAADTYAQGRLTNPTHPLWRHFDSPHVLQQPSYQSKYQPGQGLALAFGQVTTGDPLFGVWISLALASAAVCWMLQAWLPLRWAWLGGFLAATNGASLHTWGGSFMGGAVAMLGGAILVGALARSLEEPRPRNAVLLATGLLILAMTRPFEGLIASLPAGIVLFVWMARQRSFPPRLVMRRLALPLLLTLGLGACWLGYYNYRVTGDALRLPYQTYLTQHDSDVFSHPKAAELGKERLAETKTPFSERLASQVVFHLGGHGIYGLPLLLALPALLRWGWGLFALATSAATLAATALTFGAAPHYSAPIAALVIGLLAQSMSVIAGWRHFRTVARLALGTFVAVWLFNSYRLVASEARVWRDRGLKSHTAAPPTVPIPRIGDNERRPERRYWRWFTSIGMPARQVHVDRFERDPDRHLVVVRYVAGSTRHREWVYNRADIDSAASVWARWLPTEPLWPLLTYYSDRRVWYVVPERDPWEILPFPVEEVGTWFLRRHSGAKARLLPTPIAIDPIRVEIAQSGDKIWQLQLERAHPPVLEGRTYSGTFRARAAALRDIRLRVTQAYGPWQNLGLRRSFALDTEWRTYSYSFQARHSEDLPRLLFEFGHADVSLELAEVRMSSDPRAPDR